MLEVLVAITVLLVAFGALTSSLVTSSRLVHGNRESTLALEALQSAAARLRGCAFDEVFARFNDDPSDDPEGFGTAPGASFAVPGLDPAGTDGDGAVGRIEFPGGADVLRENVVDPGLGMPRDLDGDGATDDQDHADDYARLPVRVQVDWEGPAGPRRLELVTTLTRL